MPLADGATFAGYTIVRLLGSGGMGEVYLAQHPRLPRRDALKVLPASVSTDREYRERFHREADIAATLWHPHIVGVHDRGDFEGQIWISMDYVEGTDAAQLLRQQYPHGMPSSEVVAIVSAVADALDYAHQRGLLHRDVKPANILLAHPESGDERIMLADFGIARWVNDVSGLTATNMTVGTVSYAAPEQLMGERLDGRSDQYALAATAFHLLTGSPPFSHSNPAVVISQHLSASPPAIGVRRPELAELDPVFAKALAKNPNGRFERCADFARALSHRLEGAAGDDDRTRLSPVARPPKRSTLRAGVLVPAVLAVLLVVAVVFALTEFRQARDERAAEAPATTTSTTTAAPRSLPAPAQPPPATTSAAPAPATTVAAAPAAVVIGADCSPVGTTGTTEDGSTAYCSTLQGTGASIWSLTEGEIPSPTVTTAATDAPLPFAEESPVRVCMEQTGQTRRECRRDIRAGNGLPPLP
ncbi:serine/threonine-protein kinase [Mycolicibacterium holsaticum]|uniref:serine/threonine-protein kinase n=1 Tax=Mycolicibacterium holsaticum TaxID=152142 RepID=UPI001C7D9E2B|nr:serine/threonine-protein kinase [Mycolicibacterium holsaticum]MDA4107624.1 serine/threonine protein kinase [Mycolicibacterium holsaticum DSM 44478 = JCM 12374]QZA14915.1 serine/threonine protein kinase [Mycolicibacterium holsaticum DSM 44478 = JCM 12374]UNC07647.1 serine/threonine protein kinase [Mycolicibacterium holsaticum DSM 44478 = JCM 12374]